MKIYLLTRQSRLVLMALVISLLSACATSNRPYNGVVSGPEKRVSGTTEDIREVVLEIPVGDVDVVATPGPAFGATLELLCDPNHNGCQKLAKEVTLKSQVFEHVLYIGPSNRSKLAYRNAQSNYRISVPQHLPVRMVMGYGSLSVEGLESNLTIDMKAGEVSVRAPRAHVAKVWADANFGDASLSGAESGTTGDRRLLVGAEASWDEGPGEHAIVINLGAGDVSVELTSD